MTRLMPFQSNSFTSSGISAMRALRMARSHPYIFFMFSIAAFMPHSGLTPLGPQTRSLVVPLLTARVK